jgi:hypothetical protein
MSVRNRHIKLRRLLEAARRNRNEEIFWEDLGEALEEKELTPTDFSIRHLFEQFVPDGAEIVQSWSPDSGGKGVMLTEAGDAVRTGDFSDITGQILFSAVLEAYKDPVFLSDAVTMTIPTKFNGEKIPGIARIGDKAESIGENEPYPLAGVSQEFIETPETTKRGFIIPVTKEAIFFDRTGILMERATEVGYWLGVNKEKRVLDIVLGITNNYKRNNTSIDTYGDSSGAHDWDNLAASNGLVDWKQIEAAELLFDGITDPNTAEPIQVNPVTLIVPSALRHTAKRIISATEIQHVDMQANAETIRTRSANPLNNYGILSNQYVKDRTSSATTWFIGDPKRSFAYMENWPITNVSAPPNNEMEFTHDIVHREKVSERGVCAVKEPRRMVKCTA